MSHTIGVREAADLLGIARGTAYEAARSGQIAGIPVLRVGHRFLIPRAPLEALLGITTPTATGEGNDDDQSATS